MPAKRSLTIDEIVERTGKPILPLKLRNNILHMHLLKTSSGWRWIARENRNINMCGTDRCIVLEVRKVRGLEGQAALQCIHETEDGHWSPAPWGTMQCDTCGDYMVYHFGGLSKPSNRGHQRV